MLELQPGPNWSPLRTTVHPPRPGDEPLGAVLRLFKKASRSNARGVFGLNSNPLRQLSGNLLGALATPSMCPQCLAQVNLSNTDLPTRQRSLLHVRALRLGFGRHTHAAASSTRLFPTPFGKQITPHAQFFLAHLPSPRGRRKNNMGRMQNAFQAPPPRSFTAGFQDSAVCLPELASHVMRTTLQHWESEIEEIPQIDIIHHSPTFFRERLWECRCSWSTHSPTDNFVKDRFHWQERAWKPTKPPAHELLPTHSHEHQLQRHGEDPLLHPCVDVGAPPRPREPLAENPLGVVLAASDVPRPRRL